MLINDKSSKTNKWENSHLNHEISNLVKKTWTFRGPFKASIYLDKPFKISTNFN